MNVILTCKCGKKFRILLSGAVTEVVCPGCGKVSKVKAPASASAPPPPPPPAEDDDEVKLQELNVTPTVTPVFEEDDGTGFALDANDGRDNLTAGQGMYGTVAVIRLDEIASCIDYGCAGAWALAGLGEDVLVVNMQTHKKMAYYEEHEAEITSVALSATEPLALSGDDDGELHFWDLATLKRKKRIRAHKDAINALALAPNGRLAVTGGEDGTIRLWDLASGRQHDVEHADWTDYDQEVTFVAFTRDGRRFLAGGSGGRVSMWETDTGRRVKRYPGMELPISCVRLSDEGGKITATTQPIAYRGASYLTICHWDAKTAKPLDEFNIAVQTIPCCIAPDRGGNRVVIGGGADVPWMGIWSLQTGRVLYAFDHFRGTPLQLSVSPRNNRLLAALDTACLQVFGLEIA